MNGRFVRFVVKWRSTARKPGDLSNIRLVIVRSSCNGKTAAKEKAPYSFFWVIDRSKSGLFGCTNMSASHRG